MMPFVGVLLVMVVTVIVAAPQEVRADRLNLPPATLCNCGPFTEPPSIEIGATETRVNGVVSSPQSLIPEICRAQGHADGRCNGGRVQIRADAETPYGRVANTVSVLGEAGFSISLLGEDLT